MHDVAELPTVPLSETEIVGAILSIEPPGPEQLRARKVVTRSRARATGKYPSWKMGRMIEWESINELNAFRLLDANPAVRAFHEQPVVIRYRIGNEVHLHFPDVLVETRGTRELWEIKPATEAARPEYVARTRLLTESLPTHGFVYRMVLADDLAREPRLSNALTILKFGRKPILDTTREAVRMAALNSVALTWGDFESGAFSTIGRPPVCRLLLEGYLQADLDTPLTSATPLIWTDAPEALLP